MEESEWRALARLAIEELDEIEPDEQVRETLRSKLLAALAQPEGTAKAAIRDLLTSTAALRSWLDERVEGDRLRSAGPDVLTSDGTDADDDVPDFSTGPTSGAEESEDAGDEPDPDDELRGEVPTRPIVLGDDDPPPPDPGPRADEPDGADEPDELARRWLVNVEDFDESVGLVVGEARTVALFVADSTAVATITGPVAHVLEQLVEASPDTQVFSLTVQVASGDFDIAGEAVQTLRVPRTGPSLAPITWQVTPKRAGRCTLAATIHYEGNFLNQLELTLPAGEPGQGEMTSRGRAPESVATLERRDLLLVMRPSARPGYDLVVGGSVSAMPWMPITADELALVVDDVQKALFKVVSMTDDLGVPVFQTAVDIPQKQSEEALKTLAHAGAYLFNQLFFHPKSDPSLQNVGAWLKKQASLPNVQLKIQVVVENAPVPWSMLYFGDTKDGAELSWQNFLGMRHILDQVPLQPTLEVQDSKIPSDPQLSVGLNVSTTIDQEFGVTWVGDHRKRWDTLAATRGRLSLSPRSNRTSVVGALDDAATKDQIVYFLCHATSGRDGNPADAVIDMRDGGPIVLRELQSVAPPTRLAGNPLVFINACESADLNPKFYAGFVPYFLGKGARGVIGTECKVPVVLAVEFAQRFFDQLLDGALVGEGILSVRQALLEEHRNPLGLMYAVHCDADTCIDPAL